MIPNPEPEVLWNFEKFLVSREGEVVERFSPDTTPDDPALVGSVVTLLGRKQ
jgi:glutathione peroxidase